MIGIIGGGVSGLTCGIRLLEAGLPVTIWQRDPISDVVSSVAAAIWHPFQVGGEERVMEWAARSFAVFQELAADPQSGVVLKKGRELFRQQVDELPWEGIVRYVRHLEADELPPGYADGREFETAVIETPIYLRYLHHRLEANGAILIERSLASVDEALAEVPIVINCSGLAARELVNDQALFPIRGQIMRLAPLPAGLFYLDDSGPGAPTYIIPRSDGIICGGTAQHGNWDTTVDGATADRIQQGATGLMPELKDLPILEHKVGLRPGRPTVRVEREQRPGGIVVHNYGHGGSGYTLSWGCAEAVVALVTSAEC